MRKLWACIRVEFLREFDSPASIAFFLILPLVFTAAVSAGLRGMGGSGRSTEVPHEVKVRLPVLCEDQGALSAALMDTIASQDVIMEPVDALPEKQFGLIIPAGLTDSLLAGNPVTLTLQVPGAVSDVAVVEQILQPAVQRLGATIQVARASVEYARAIKILAAGQEQAFFDRLIGDIMEAAKRPPVAPQVTWSEGAQVAEASLTDMASNTEQASAGQLVTWVQITLLGAAEVLVGERSLGTLRRMFVMPASRAGLLGGKFLARLLLGLTQITILLVGGTLLFGVEWGRDPLAVAVISLAFALASVGLGILLSTIVRTRGQANSAVVGLSMALAALGGAWYPIEITPPVYRQVVQVLPSTWAMRAYTDLLARDAGIPDILPEVGILLVFAATFIILGLVRFRKYH